MDSKVSSPDVNDTDVQVDGVFVLPDAKTGSLKYGLPADLKNKKSRRRINRKIVLVVALLILIAPTWSYANAMTSAGSDPIKVRTVEWIRDHHGRWFVNDVEALWYKTHPPKVGGTPKPLPFAANSNDSSVSISSTVDHSTAPDPIVPLAENPVADEGKWRPLGQTVKGLPAMYSTYVRPDNVHTSILTGVVWIDPKLVKFVNFAGKTQPGGSGWKYETPVPTDMRATLLAAFNSAFKLQDSLGGYFAYGKYAKPMVNDKATLVIKQDGTATVGQWGRDLQMTTDVDVARQNLSLIVDDSLTVPNIDNGPNSKWGATLGNKLLVWRSGLGVRSDGSLVFAAGGGLSAGSLANVLVAAGAVKAMELDINSSWVDFFSYMPAPVGNTSTDPVGTKLLPGMSPSPNVYFGSSSHDFIALFPR